MAVTNSPDNIMQKSLLNKCQGLLEDVSFVEAKTFYWAPSSRSIHFDPLALQTKKGQWALLHELAHAQLNHTIYTSDAELLKLEVAAWKTAQETAKGLNIEIDSEHIEDCLDTYRDWLYARSTCPACSLNSLQVAETTYACINCRSRWSVSRSRFCRPYRMQSMHKKTPPGQSQTVFS